MKNILCISLLYCLISSGYAQTVTFTKKSDQLTEALGHRINRDGSTMDNKNQISDEQEKSINSLANNFKWMQIAAMKYKGKQYHVLYYQSQSGDYEYPLTQAGWRERTQISYWIMDDAEYAQLKKTVNQKAGTDAHVTSYIDYHEFYVTEYSEPELLAKITETFTHDLETETHATCMIINSQAGVVRFSLPKMCLSSDYLKHGYYEVKTDEFKKLLID
jgi:hypothetical protein